jgi:hypothetical protein
MCLASSAPRMGLVGRHNGSYNSMSGLGLGVLRSFSSGSNTASASSGSNTHHQSRGGPGVHTKQAKLKSSATTQHDWRRPKRDFPESPTAVKAVKQNLSQSPWRMRFLVMLVGGVCIHLQYRVDVYIYIYIYIYVCVCFVIGLSILIGIGVHNK